MCFGNSFIILMACISGISKDYFEAALIDGANWWQSFVNVTLPQLKPILLYVLITSLIGGLQMFDLPMLLTDTRRSEEHTSELQSRGHLVCRLLLEKKKKKNSNANTCDTNIN